jgi:NADPH:quinone reductase-like Zn-dependent oxidoreductase
MSYLLFFFFLCYLAEYIVAKEKAFAHKPSNLSFVETAGLPLEIIITIYQRLKKLNFLPVNLDL